MAEKKPPLDRMTLSLIGVSALVLVAWTAWERLVIPLIFVAVIAGAWMVFLADAVETWVWIAGEWREFYYTAVNAVAKR